MTFHYAESHVEEATLAYLADLGYQIAAGPDVAPDTMEAERTSYTDVVLVGRLTAAVARLNPHAPHVAGEDAIRQVLRSDYQNAVEENRRLHRLIVEGVPVEFAGEDGAIKSETIRLRRSRRPRRQRLARRQPVHRHREQGEPPTGYGDLRQRPAAGRDRAEEPRR